MTTFELLRQTAAVLARRLEMATDPELTQVTAAMARAAVEWTHLTDPVISRALAHLDSCATPDAELCFKVQSLAVKLDENYFVLSESHEERNESPFADAKVRMAFSQARAASAVAAALANEEARAGAAKTAYEALAAIGNPEYLVAVADKAIRNQ